MSFIPMKNVVTVVLKKMHNNVESVMTKLNLDRRILPFNLLKAE